MIPVNYCKHVCGPCDNADKYGNCKINPRLNKRGSMTVCGSATGSDNVVKSGHRDLENLAGRQEPEETSTRDE